MNDEDPLPEPLIDKEYDIHIIPAKLAKAKAKRYSPFPKVDIGHALNILDKLYILRRKLVVRPRGNNKIELEYWALYRIATKPLWLSASGNWSFKAVTYDPNLIGKDSADPVTERIWINHKNISNFLFDKRTILVYNEVIKSRLFLQRAKAKKFEEEYKKKQEEEEQAAIQRYEHEKEQAKRKKTTIILEDEDFKRAHTIKLNYKYLRRSEDEGDTK